MSTTENGRVGPHECPFDEDYYAWVVDETAYVRGYRVDATCGECDSQLEARVEEHMLVFSCYGCVEWGGDPIGYRSVASPVEWRTSVPNTTDLTEWKFYLTGESAEIEPVPHGITVRDSFTADGDEHVVHVALPEEGQEYDIEANGGDSA